MKDAIILEKVTKLYKNHHSSSSKLALQNLSLSIPKGCIFGLLGPNGAGKSSLINILAGIVTKTSGKVLISGHDIDKSPKHAKLQIGVVPQEIILDSFFPIYKTLEFTAGYYGIRPHLRKTEEILKALGLFEKKEALPRQLSGGMKRRFLIAKALVHSPSVLVLDEPTAGVDLELREQLWTYVRKLNNEGVTIIITTHYLLEAQELCDQIAFINNGKIIKQDTRNNLLNTLSRRYVHIEFADMLTDKVIRFITASQYKILSPYSICAEFTHNDYDLNSLLLNLSKIRVKIKNLHVSQPDLESIFKELIK